MFLHRSNCVLCQNELLQFYEKKDFPIHCCGEKKSIEWTMKLGRCKNCHSIQQMNLIPSELLYGGTYLLDTNYSTVWITHHDDFCNFICQSIPEGLTITEIGSSSQVLIKRLMKKVNYNFIVFDFSLDTAIRDPSVTYIEGNCETYSFPKDSILVMSHVFEHLYEPSLFLDNCFKNKVSDLLISIPNMNDIRQVSITREHTFTYKDSDIERLFEKHGYTCVKKHFYLSNHSIFFHFKLNTATETFFQQEYIVPKNSYLVGAGFNSQVIYHNIQNKDAIIGIVDNDITKQGKLFYNTSFIIEPFHVLKHVECVIVMKHKYWTEEIVTAIRLIHPNIQIYYV